MHRTWARLLVLMSMPVSSCLSDELEICVLGKEWDFVCWVVKDSSMNILLLTSASFNHFPKVYTYQCFLIYLQSVFLEFNDFPKVTKFFKIKECFHHSHICSIASSFRLISTSLSLIWVYLPPIVSLNLFCFHEFNNFWGTFLQLFTKFCEELQIGCLNSTYLSFLIFLIIKHFHSVFNDLPATDWFLLQRYNQLT